MPNEAAKSSDSVPGIAPLPAMPSSKLADLPADELERLAEELGIEPKGHKTKLHLVAAIEERKAAVAAMDREAMLDVVRWGRRPVAVNASKDQLALEIARIKSMRFDGLSVRGLMVLAAMRGIKVTGKEPPEAVAKALTKQEGFFARLSRKRRAVVGKWVAGMIGEEQPADGEYQFLPPEQQASNPGTPPPARKEKLAEEIEESGLFGGLASRVKKTADVYLNQKLDEIEQRIDRKLDEIDRRLGEWRDKEIANRIRIMKITLWASVAVAALSLLYSYISVYF
jgi:hypothetical protein